MAFESMSNFEAQEEYEAAIRDLAVNPVGPSYNKAINALMKLYPQWKQYEWEHCLSEDLKEIEEENARHEDWKSCALPSFR